MLSRGGQPNFGKIGSLFGGDIMSDNIGQVEIKSGK
jgi:hypothetical protein